MANKNLFNSVQLNRPRRNTFDLTYDHKLSFNMGKLIPILCMEAIPGDKFSLGNDALIRFQPMVSPVMHRFDVTCHYFFVPNRIIWPGWEDWIVNKEGAPAHPFVIVDTVNYPSFGTGIPDYLGIPEPIGALEEKISALPFAAYHKIFNEYYRDQNLQTSVIDTCINGDNEINVTSLFELRNRAWEHDYFTSALPFAQKGDAVDLPLGEVTLKDPWFDVANLPPLFRETDQSPADPTSTLVADGSVLPGIATTATPGEVLAYDPMGTLQVGATTINDLRRAFRLQEWLERNARAGTRYSESIQGHFGITPDDARLQRPEYITGTKTPVVISAVSNTMGELATEGGRPQGDLSGNAVAVQSGKYGSYFCKEHGYIIGIMSVMPRTAYMQGIPKHFLKYEDPFQLAWPEFANIGEQEIQNREIYAFQTGTTGLEVFGYTPRYAEYKYQPNMVSGRFRNSLDHWHAARKFDAPPALNAAFIQCDPTNRIFAVTDESEDKMLAHVLNKVYCSRLLPRFGTPTI